MKLTVLGSGTTAWINDKTCSCYLIKTDSIFVMIDCGPGALRRCQEVGADIFDIDVLVLSHTQHCDHSADFPSLLFALNYGFRPEGQKIRSKTLTILGPPGTEDYYRTLLTIYPKIKPKHYELKIEEFDSFSTFSVAKMKFKIAPVIHGCPAIGCRIEANGKIFGYTGDTSFCSQLNTLFVGCDLLLIECSYLEGSANMKTHLSAREVGIIGKNTKSKQLAITHCYPFGTQNQMEEQIRENYTGDIVFVEDKISYEI